MNNQPESPEGLLIAVGIRREGNKYKCVEITLKGNELVNERAVYPDEDSGKLSEAVSHFKLGSISLISTFLTKVVEG